MSIAYYLEMLNLLVLLFPSILLLPLIPFVKKLNDFDIFLLIACCFLMLLPIAWKAALGVLNDWNLYAMIAIPVSLFVWFNLLQLAERKQKILIIVMLMFSMLNTFSWVVNNHVG